MSKAGHGSSKRPKVLMAAYAVSPFLGSEYGVGWNFITRLAAYYDITVLYGTSGGKMGNNAELAEYLQKKTVPGVEFVYISPGFLASLFDALNRKLSPLFFPVAFTLYQRKVFGKARQLTRSGGYSLAHQLNPIGFRQPGLLWKLEIPFVWGPVGGTSDLNKIFFNSLSASELIRNIIRNCSNKYFLRFSRKVCSATKAAHTVFCATSADRENFLRYLKVDCPVIRENSVRNLSSSYRKTACPTKFVWVGSVDQRKALNLLLLALGRLDSELEWVLDVIGDGPSKTQYQLLSDALGLADRIKWHGSIARESVMAVMNDSDVHVITSIMDSNPTVLLESFEACIPTIALAHFGMNDLIDDEVGFKVSVTSLSDIVNELHKIINICINNPNEIDRRKEKILQRQADLHWDVTIQKVKRIYESVGNV